MEGPFDRLRKWIPDMVLVSEEFQAIMVNPDTSKRLTQSMRLRLIANRNLCKRTLQKFCTINNEHN